MKTNFWTDPLTDEERSEREYTAPDFVLEIDLETRAGSVLPSSPDPLDITGLGSGTDYIP